LTIVFGRCGKRDEPFPRRDLRGGCAQPGSLEGRQQLHAGIDGLVRQALGTGQEVNLVLDVRRVGLASDRQCTVKLVYVVHPKQ
jgi:hypothetical protein